MANIVRCEMPDGVHRFKPFTVADYRDLLLVRNDMNNKPVEEQKQLLDELLEDYFGEYPKAWRPYIFLKVFTSSLGKTKVPVAFECQKCKKTKQTLFNMSQGPLTNPTMETAGIKIQFKFPEVEYKDKSELVLNTIQTVEDSEQKYNWEDLPEETKMQVIDAIDIESLEELLKKMHSVYIPFTYGCCEKHKTEYTDLIDVFKLILNPDEVFVFYQINHLLVKNQYTLDSIMHMIPIERGIALSLVEKDLKK